LLRLPAHARLREAASFGQLRRDSQRLASNYFQIQYRPGPAGGARLGMAVSRRVSKRAVVRNRIRRQIRETFRIARARLPDCDILVMARGASAQTPSPVLRAELQSLWERLAALKPSAPARTI
jgi:ribonuclease P protein component